jgi:type I restriction enzyme S subunit
MSMRSGQPGINGNEYGQLPIPLPPIPEQRAIATTLSDVDALIAALEKLIGKKRDLKQAATQQLLTGKTRLPGFHSEWEVKRLKTVLKLQVGFPFSSNYFNDEGNGIRLIRNRDLKGNNQPIYFEGPFDDAYLVKHGDLLISMDGEFVPCLWKTGPALLNQRVGRIIPRTGLDPTFAFYFLVKPLSTIEAATSGTTVKHLAHGDLDDIEVPLPSFEEQIAIAAVLSDMGAEIAALEAVGDKTRNLKKGMMQELLTGRVRLV